MRPLGGLLFPALLAVSLALHGWLIGTASFPGSPPSAVALEKAETVVAIIREIPAEPEQEPPPQPPEPLEPHEPEPLPPEPPEPQILATETEDAPPAPVAPPKPFPQATPKVKRPPTPKKSKPMPSKPAPAAPRGAVVAARPDSPKNRPPAYPEHARRQGWEGKVLVRATVGADGRVQSASLAKTSGYGLLDQAALRAVRGWKFRPQTIGGIPAQATIEVPVNFSLRR